MFKLYEGIGIFPTGSANVSPSSTLASAMATQETQFPQSGWGPFAVPIAAREAIAEAVRPDGIATMLYGSYARGDSTPDSDIDVLELVASTPRSYSRGRVNVSQYLPAHLRRM